RPAVPFEHLPSGNQKVSEIAASKDYATGVAERLPHQSPYLSTDRSIHLFKLS
ncbi:MAG: hypothetical protein ACI9UA_005547, partial [Pseudoalteromonas tetraodonis]